MLFNLDIQDKYRNALTDASWRIVAKVEDESIDLMIMDQIGDDGFGGVAASDVVSTLDRFPDSPVNVRINSPGGLVYDGLVIYNALANRGPDVTATIEGLAFSAASFIAMAADRIVMHEASDIGIHRAAGLAFGNQNDMRSVAAWLNTIDEHLIDIYGQRTGASRDQVETWLDGTSDGTLFSAKEALAVGFADEIIPLKTGKAAAAKEEHLEQIAAVKTNYRQEAIRKAIASRRSITKQLTK